MTVTVRDTTHPVVTATVITHPRRLDQARALAAALPGGVCDVVTDPDPSGPPSELRTALRGWSSAGDRATHHLLMHDDMSPHPGLLKRVHAAVRAHPDAALALFAFWGSRNGAAVRQGTLSGARWVRAVNEWTPTNAVVLPREVAARFVTWAGTRRTSWPADVLLHRFLREQGVPAYVAVPNLVEHDNVRSLANNDYQGLRRSACFLPDEPVRPGDELLREPSAVPFFVAFTSAAAQAVVPVSGADLPRTRHIQCAEYLDRFAVDVSRLRERRRPDAPGVTDDLAWMTWLTAYTMGVVNQADGHAAVSLDDPVLRAALGTMVQGGISHLVDAAAASRTAAALEATIFDGLEAGLGPLRSRRSAAGPRLGVLGADTFLAEYLVTRLADLGRRVTRIDPDEPSLDGIDVIVLAGRHATAFGAEISAADVERERDQIRALLTVREGARVVLLSSYRVYDGCTGRVDETTPLAGGDPVTVALREVELLCGDAGAVTLRLGAVYGPGTPPDRTITKMAGHAAASRPITACTGGWPIQLVHLKDVADAVAAVVDRPPADRLVNVSGSEPLHRGELVDLVCRVVRPVDDRPVACAGGDNPVVDVSRARRLGWRPTVEVEHGLHGLTQWLAHDTYWEPDADTTTCQCRADRPH
ncbi:NAD-dependent epimerase/dehydratase family protein [Micromonospora sp. CPCC 205539]|uniref:NAD-dependent epimerase/dehydratase family protein n=1 Tax=Micromonospora sp. CPCC 205539 TaxID=3122408 RepID=UPI002FF271FD